MNECENCGKKTQCQDFWGIVHCQSCKRMYLKAQQESINILLRRHKSEFDKILDEELSK